MSFYKYKFIIPFIKPSFQLKMSFLLRVGLCFMFALKYTGADSELVLTHTAHTYYLMIVHLSSSLIDSGSCASLVDMFHCCIVPLSAQALCMPVNVPRAYQCMGITCIFTVRLKDSVPKVNVKATYCLKLRINACLSYMQFNCTSFTCSGCFSCCIMCFFEYFQDWRFNIKQKCQPITIKMAKYQWKFKLQIRFMFT